MNYPTTEEVKNANHVQICTWYRHLPSPGSNLSNSMDQDEFSKKITEQGEVMNLICEKFKEGGGFTPEISKMVGWEW